MCVEAKLTRHQYNTICKFCENRFPSHKQIQVERKECSRIKESIEITNTSAQFKLQYLLKHIATRFLQVLRDVLQVQKPKSKQNLILVYKWGMDGSAQSEYKRRFSDPNLKDAYILISS